MSTPHAVHRQIPPPAEPALAELPWKGAAALELNTGRRYLAVDGVLRVEVPAMEALRLESAEV